MSEARRFIEAHTAEIEPLHADYNLKYWNASISGDAADTAASAAAKEKLFQVYTRREECAAVKALAAGADLDPLLARQLRLIGLEYGARQMDPAVLADIVRREEEIEGSFNSFRATLDGRRVTENDLRGVLRDERDVNRRRAAWEASKQIGAAVRDPLLDLVRLRNREARRLGHRDYYAMAMELQELGERELFGLLGRLKSLSESPFREMKAGLDRQLARRYGTAAIEPYPWMYSDPFFQEAPPGSADIDLDGIFAGQDLEALTRRTFDGINLPVSEIFPRSDLHEKEGKCQHAFCTHIDRKGDVRVLANVKPDEYWMTTLLHEFGHAIYDRYLDMELPFLLRAPAHVSSTEAVAMLMGRLTRDAAWLEAVAGVPAVEAARLEAEIGRALRVSQLIFMRWGLLVVHFERELYRDPDQDLDALWWRMAADFQMIRPPEARRSPDWASKIHFSTAPAYYQNYLLGEMTASQLQRRLEEALPGEARGHRSPTDRPAAGRFLRDNLFRNGARYHWQETLARATGEELNPDHYLNQFVRTP